MKLRIVGTLACLGLAASSAAAVHDDAANQILSNPDLYYLDHHDVSPPLRDMPVIESRRPAEREVNPANVIPVMPQVARPKDWIDPLEALSYAPPTPEVGTVAGLNFEGVQGGAYPPDTNGAVGATQFVEWVNFSLAVYSKTTGALVYGPVAGNTLWQGFGGLCETTNSGDPIVAYDKAASRWVMTQFAFSSVTGGPWYQCVAVSTSSDATGTWRRFAYNFAALNDYPKLGVWPDGYYITFNMFNSGSSFAGARTCALDRINMITPSNTPGPIQCFQNSAWASLMPADLDGSTPPPAGSPNYQLSLGGSPTLRLYKFKVNWTTPSLSTFTGPTSITVAAYTQPATSSAVTQPGTTVRLDSLGDRLMFRLAYRNFGTHEALVDTHSVSTSSTLGVRWYEIRNPNGTPTVYQQGTFAPDSTARWMGSIAQDRDGNMAVGYSVSSSSVYPGIRYTGRLSTDALGTMQTENTIVSGSRSQTNYSRWGDYAAMTIDPSDDCTFWFTTEYLRTGTTTGSTRVASFKFPGCGAPPDFSIACSPSSLALPRSQSRSTTCTVTSTGGFSSAVTLSCGGLPAGVTCSASPNPVTPPANGGVNSTVTFTASSSATLGTFSVQAVGTSGGTVRSANVTLTVTDPVVVSISGDYTQATCSASGGTPGYTYYWYVTPSSCPPPDPCASPRPGQIIPPCCFAARDSGDACPFQAPSPNPICPEEGPYTSSPTNRWFWNGTEASIRCSATDAVNTTGFSPSFTRPAPPPDFTLSCNPTSVTVSPGGAASTTCTVTSLNSFASAVTLSCANVPANVTCTPSPNPITPPANGSAGSSVTFSAASNAALGSTSVQISGTGGGLTRTTNVTLSVSSGPLSASISVVNFVATCNASGGTPPYTFKWYVRYPCDPCLIAQKDAAARGELVPPCPFTDPGTEAICPWEGPYTSSPPNQWQLYGDETGVRCNVTDTVGASVTVTKLL